MAVQGTDIQDLEEVEQATISTPWGTVNVEYKPSLVILANDVADDDDDPEAPSKLATSLCKMVVSWEDFTGPILNPNSGEELVPDGVVVPLDPDIVQYVRYGFLSAVLQGLIRAESPNQVKRRNRSRRRS